MERTFRREWPRTNAERVRKWTHGVSDSRKRNGVTVLIHLHSLLSAYVVPQHAASSCVRATRQVARVNLWINGLTTVIVLAVTGITIIHLVAVHSSGFHTVCSTIYSVFHAATVLQEPHRLHILRLLVNSGKVVRKEIVRHKAVRIYVLPHLRFPNLLPSVVKFLLGIVATVAEHQHVKQVVRHFASHSQVYLQLVIVYHTLEVACPHRIGRLSEFQFCYPRWFCRGRFHHVINASHSLPPVHGIISQQFITAYRIQHLTCYLPLAIYLLHFSALCSPSTALVCHKAVVLATIKGEHIEFTFVCGTIALEAWFDFIKGFVSSAEVFDEVAIVQTPFVVAGCVFETECHLLAFILFPITFGMEPSIGKTFHSRTECGNRVVGSRMVHRQSAQWYVSFYPCSVKGTLCRSQIVVAKGTICSIHKVTNSAVIGIATIGVVHLYRDDFHRYRILAYTYIA